MRSSTFAMLIIAILLLTSGCVLAQIDNSNDPRLDQKITYDSGYKRLHTVADDLTSLTGVAITSGKTANDWHVRDIPLVVCVKDMPLGRLLRAISAATHCCCAPDTASGGKISYRICRGPAEQARIDTYLAQAREFALAESKWTWDAMTIFGKREIAPESDSRLWLISKLVSTLGPEAKSRLFGGDAVLIRGSDPARHELMAQLYKSAWHVVPQYIKLQNQPTNLEINSATLAIELRDPGYYRSIAIRITIDPVVQEGKLGSWTTEIGPNELKKYYDSSFPKYPEEPVTDAYKETVDVPGCSLAIWDRPYLKARFDLDLPAGKKYPNFSDLIRSVAQMGDCNIVAEDFISNLDSSYAPIHAAFGKNKSVSETLRELSGLINSIGYTWFTCDNDKLVLGWAGYGSMIRWQNCHAGLLPEAYINNLHSKYNSSGLDLDDFMHFTSLTDNIGCGAYDPTDPYVMWINNADGFYKLYDSCIASSGFWRIYDSLSASDKLLAKSAKGYPLSKLNAAWVANILRQRRLGRINETMRYKDIYEEIRAMMAVMADPKVISTMVMYISKSPAFNLNHHLSPDDYGVDMDDEDAAKILGLNKYKLLIKYKVNGKNYEVHCSVVGPAFPIRSPEREEQILKTALRRARLSGLSRLSR